ncbi:WD40 repeat-like protein [Conidiobolus coronatus NRRL 28638]|uniref:WD40 repeat-like protein n=1 Tax=Conidiobolus coronatus (strain ATCC 28846 / CBS 209.66 / NRRL 28638) TaxID=796925 RepID=A0A137PB35_CONC2|nr:WD40 repeat-like protein [Conidiobolus coronatus NRRL 28638]|eukprot:KXN72141.1 WD40 repeat-like protein [Conidiobolus coronatus NRRL 28638]
MAATATTSNTYAFDSQHEDMIHDAQLDFYGKKLATCSSDRSIRIFEVEENSQRLIQVLNGHDGPVWQVAWAHPKFGNILASCSYDGRALIWKETNGTWTQIKEHSSHSSSVNSIAWAPHELGPILACASSDGKVSVLTYRDDGTWESTVFDAHAIGCNSVSWAPAIAPGALTQSTGNPSETQQVKRFATAGCDNLVKIWAFKNDAWQEEETGLEGHSDWVRDVAWAPNVGMPRNYIASCSQDKTVIIWTQDSPNSPWTKTALKADRFPDVVWRVSWSLSGNILAVSCGDNTVSLWKEGLNGVWEMFNELKESTN